MFRRTSHLLTAGLLCAIACSAARTASAQIAVDFTDATGGSGFAPNTTSGYAFNLSSAKDVKALGIWDQDANGLSESHAVGLWTSTGTLLAQALVTNASAVVPSINGQWLFEAITSVHLAPGDYVLGGYYGLGSDHFSVFGHVSTAPGMTMGTSLDDEGGGPPPPGIQSAGLTFPTTSFGPNRGFLGPNMQFGVAGPSSVPEASSIVLMLAGGLPLGLVLRKRTSRKG